MTDAPQMNAGDISFWPILKIDYPTDADKIAALLPPGIDPSDSANICPSLGPFAAALVTGLPTTCGRTNTRTTCPTTFPISAAPPCFARACVKIIPVHAGISPAHSGAGPSSHNSSDHVNQASVHIACLCRRRRIAYFFGFPSTVAAASGCSRYAATAIT